MPGKYSRNDLATQFKSCVEARQPMRFAGQVLHRLGLCDEDGRLYRNEQTRLPTFGPKRLDRTSDYNLHALTEAMLGQDWVETLGLNNSGGFPVKRWMQESDLGPVGPSFFQTVNAWSNVVAGLMQAEAIEGWESPEYDIWNLFPSQETQVWDRAKRIGILGPMEPAREFGPGDPHPHLPMSMLWVETGRIKKYGYEITIAKETAHVDITGGQVLQRAKEGGKALAFRENELALDAITGTTNSFRLAFGQDEAATGYNTYDPTINGVLIDNDFVNPMVDPSSLYAIDTRVSEYVHPVYPNVPIKVDMNTMLVPTRLRYYAESLMGAPKFTIGSQPGSPYPQIASSTFPTGLMEVDNPFKSRYTVKASTWLDLRHRQAGLSGAGLGRYYVMDPAKAILRRVAWNVTTVDLNPSDYTLINRGIIAGQVGDVAVQYQVMSPWHIMRCRGS